MAGRRGAAGTWWVLGLAALTVLAFGARAWGLFAAGGMSPEQRDSLIHAGVIAAAVQTYADEHGAPPPDLDALRAWAGAELPSRIFKARGRAPADLPTPHYRYWPSSFGDPARILISEDPTCDRGDGLVMIFGDGRHAVVGGSAAQP